MHSPEKFCLKGVQQIYRLAQRSERRTTSMFVHQQNKKMGELGEENVTILLRGRNCHYTIENYDSTESLDVKLILFTSDEARARGNI
jgi:hypothetical protein